MARILSIVEDATGFLLIIKDLIDEDWMPCSASNNKFVTVSSKGATLCNLLFPVILQAQRACDVCGLRPPSFESSSVSYAIPTNIASMQKLIM